MIATLKPGFAGEGRRFPERSDNKIKSGELK